MLTIHCTKKLLSQLKIDINKENIINTPIFSWHSHLFFINRRKCIIVMNDKTRFNFMLYGLKKIDFLNFDSVVINGIRKNLLDEGIDNIIVEKYIQQCDEVIYDKSSERSIISQINEMRMFIEVVFKDDKANGVETDINKLNRSLNKFVMMRLPKLYSGETMRDELAELFSN